MTKELSVSEKKNYLNQSNVISNAYCKISSPASYKIIKYGLYKIDKTFDISKYKDIDLFNETNWNKINFSDFTCEFTISDFCKTLKISDGTSLRKPIFEMLNNATAEHIKVQDGNSCSWYPFFVKAEYQENKKIKLVFNPGVIGVALDNERFYSHLELEAIGKLRTTYSIRYYELIQSYYNMKGRYRNKSGSWKTDLLTVEFLREYLQIDKDAYAGRMDNFKKFCVEKPISELTEKSTNLSVEIETVKEKNCVKGFILHCTEKIKTLKISSEESSEQKEFKSAVNDYDQKVNLMKEKYPEIWEKYADEIKAKNEGPVLEAYLNNTVFERMLDEDYVI